MKIGEREERPLIEVIPRTEPVPQKIEEPARREQPVEPRHVPAREPVSP